VWVREPINCDFCFFNTETPSKAVHTTRVSTALPLFKAMLKVREGVGVDQGTDQL
jgi:hypothetical protein